MSKRICTLSAACLWCATGCVDNDLTSEEHVRTWANTASAVGSFTRIYEPNAYADGEFVFDDTDCPTVTEEGDTITLEGDCTETDGDQRVGRAIIVTAANGDRTITLEGYGTTDSRLTGTVEITAVSATEHDFVLDFDHEGGVVTRYEYSGSVEGTYGTPTVWNGSGTVERDGIAPNGPIEATTVDQRVDDEVCAGASVSGTTTLVAGGHTAVIEYDGATDCDDDNNAQWSVDGVDQGAIEGISCAVRPGARSSAAWIALASIALVLARRRACPRSRTR
jgi:hypothetical protein